MKKIATIISRVFDPFIVMMVAAIIAVRHSTLNNQSQLLFFITAIVLMIGVPALLLVLSIKKKWISNWDMSIRSERPKALLVMLAVEFASLLILRPLSDALLFLFILEVIVWSIGFSCVTYFWKISGHSGIAALGTGLIVSWFGFHFWPILLIVPLVAWSRVVRKDHTVAQVIAGAFYSWALILLFSLR